MPLILAIRLISIITTYLDLNPGVIVVKLFQRIEVEASRRGHMTFLDSTIKLFGQWPRSAMIIISLVSLVGSGAFYSTSIVYAAAA